MNKYEPLSKIGGAFKIRVRTPAFQWLNIYKPRHFGAMKSLESEQSSNLESGSVLLMKTLPRPDKRGIYFGGVHLPETAATSHFMIVGSTGSGKTLTLQMMMKSVLPSLLTDPDQRALLFDVKQDAYSVLCGILQEKLTALRENEADIQRIITERIVLLNPFDRRCYEWDIAKDVTSPEVALQIATTFIPEEESQNRYFTDAARDLLTGVINVFIDRQAEWYLSDLLYVMRSPGRLRQVLSQTEEGRDLVSLHMEGGNTTRSVISTARSKLAPFEVVAALWRHAGRNGKRVSLRDFVKSNRILVMGNNQAALAPIKAINRVLFQRITELVLDQTESTTRRNWFFLDEARKLDRLEGLDDLMTNGRSKGASVVLGFQDIDGMRAVYGKEIAGEITSMCGSFGILRVSGASTPQWASEIFGEQEVIQVVQSWADSVNYMGESQGRNYTQSEQIREKKLYLPAEFRMLPRPQKGKPFVGYFCTVYTGSEPYRAELQPHQVDSMLPHRADVPDFLSWEDPSTGATLEAVNKIKKLPSWQAGDFNRLKLPDLSATDAETTHGNQSSSGSNTQSSFIDPNIRRSYPAESLEVVSDE